MTDFKIMGVVNVTPDSFSDGGLFLDADKAIAHGIELAKEGADIVDIGGVPARPGDDVDVREEVRRTVPFIAAVRDAYPELVISVDTWRHEVGREACAAGADLLNDSWGGWDPRLAEAAAEFGAGIICSHAGGLPPRTRPFRVAYDDVVQDVLAGTLALAARAVAAGVERERILIDPAHDFGKNTWHSLEVTRRLAELVGTGWPVLVSMSNKDFIGETLDAAQHDRLSGTLATVVFCILHGARIVRVHDTAATVDAVRMTEAMLGWRPPAYTRHNI